MMILFLYVHSTVQLEQSWMNKQEPTMINGEINVGDDVEQKWAKFIANNFYGQHYRNKKNTIQSNLSPEEYILLLSSTANRAELPTLSLLQQKKTKQHSHKLETTPQFHRHHNANNDEHVIIDPTINWYYGYSNEGMRNYYD